MRSVKKEIFKMKAYAITDIGRQRKSNQDACYYTTEPIGDLQNLFLVADGMGGHNAGDVASKFTIESFIDIVKTHDDLRDAVTLLAQTVRDVNAKVYEKASEYLEYNGMGTTLVAATIENNTIKIVNIGDSRLYLIENGNILQITRDHSLVEEMVNRGQINKEEARTHANKNIITRAVGASEDVTPEVFSVDLTEDSKILICTDGLTNMVADDDILRIVGTSKNLKEVAEELVNTANDNGGKDNITVMLIDPVNDEDDDLRKVSNVE